MKNSKFAFDKLELIKIANALMDERISKISAIDLLTKRKVRAFADPKLNLNSIIKTIDNKEEITQVLSDIDFTSLEISTKIKESAIKGMIFYCLSLKDFDPTKNGAGPSLNLLIDMYKNAYLEGGLRLLKDFISKEYSWYNLSPIFGPGYFGMNLDKSEVFARILNLSSIDVFVSKGGFTPEKTCVGLVFVMDEIFSMDESPCSYCGGNTSNCEFCKFVNINI